MTFEKFLSVGMDKNTAAAAQWHIESSCTIHHTFILKF